MLKIKPEFWTKNGGEQFVVLTREDFEKVQELLEDAGLARILDNARRAEADAPTLGLADVKRRLSGSKRTARRRSA
jgi:hypothetical protein